MKFSRSTHSSVSQQINPVAKLLVMLGLAATGNLLYVLPLLAIPPVAGASIDNQATGSFVDGEDPNGAQQDVLSNVVKLTVAEVAGVNVSAALPVVAPATVVGAGPYQSYADVYPGTVVYFDFTISNVGNDPTQFMIPSTATALGGGTVGQLQIIGYNNVVFDGLAGRPNAVNVPTTFAPTTNSTGTLLNGITSANGGSVFAGDSIKVRVPVTITAGAGSTVTVMLGNTPADSASTTTPQERLQNQVFTNNSSTDIYTKDNNDPAVAATTPGVDQEVIGAPANGVREASAIAAVTVLGSNLSGNVFEDIKYGGGAGRTKATPGSAGIDGARVELYDSNGKFVRSTTTSTGGNYSFPGVPAGDFYIRTVSNTVGSSRDTDTGLIPVQTFVTDASTLNQVNDVVNKVGGEIPSQVDAENGGTGAVFSPATGRFTTAGGNAIVGNYIQSLTKVKVGTAAIGGLDFGYNFDTIVNTNNAGQGSLRQFILNSNALPNTSTFQQDGQLAGREVSIFMIPNGSGNAGQRSGLTNQVTSAGNNSGAAVITLASPLDAVTDGSTTITGFTQTTNIGNTNAGQVGTAPMVGVDGLTVAKVERPEIVIDGRNLTDSTNADQYAITLNGDRAILRGVAVYGTKGTYATSAGGDSGAVRVGKSTGSNVANAAIIDQNLIGTYADGTDPGSLLQNQRYGTICFAACEITNNYIAYNGYGTVLYGAGANSSKITGNEYQSNGPNSAPSSGQKSAEGDSIGVWSASNALIQGNLIANTRGVGSNTLDGGKGIELVSTLADATTGNQIKNNTIDAASTAGIGAYNNASGNTIYRNVIKNTSPVAGSPAYAGAGILLSPSSSVIPATVTNIPVHNTISENSIYGNSGLGIDIDSIAWKLGDGVSPNDGLTPATLPNIGLDYPVISSANISGGNLTVKGFVGNIVTSGNFGGLKLEFFVADNSPANQNGPVLLGDGKNKPHGEGKTFIGSCTTQPDSTFNCVLPANGLTNAINITATATDSLGNTSEFSSVSINNPNVLLVKRITSINGSTNTFNGQDLASYNHENGDTRDNDAQWPSGFLLGGFNGGNVKPGDVVEYTIYFLSKGEGTANNVSICDLIPEKQTFVPSIATWTGAPLVPSAVGGSGGNSGIVAQYNNQTLGYSNLADGDKARYIPADPSTPLPNACRPSPNAALPLNTNGAIIIELGTVVNQVNSTATDKPYGFLRFRTKVN
jgi:uncharacterized repeat protein (TIGR01451 family)